MVRGLIELSLLDGNAEYVNDVRKSLDYAWKHARTPLGLFHADMSGKNPDKAHWLLTQAAMAEMYARLGLL